MECKFLKHGLAISYDQIVKPCCAWKISPEWHQNQNYHQVDLVQWHQSKPVVEQRQILESGSWPTACVECKKIESQNRYDSVRGNGNHAYADYQDDDITLEIRPGNTCNFACQTCWPEASSRVAQYHNQAGFINIKDLNSHRIDDFEFLLPIAHRIKNVVLLGGEPFYDKSCLKFLAWAQKNLTSNIMLFTNGSMVDMNFIQQYPGRLTIIFSLDAMDRAAEYIRFGTVWSQVLENYLQVKKLPNVEVRVNITCSVYNYLYLESLLEFLSQDWPAVVSFGTPFKDYLRESSIPCDLRAPIVQSLTRGLSLLTTARIPSDQKNNAINAIKAIVNNLNTVSYDLSNHQKLQKFIVGMDSVKQIHAEDYCNFLARLKQEVA